jgi:hypothetical protein
MMEHQAHDRFLAAAARSKADRDYLSSLPVSTSAEVRAAAEHRARYSHNAEGIAFAELQRVRRRAA